MSLTNTEALLMAGIPQLNSALYHRIRFLVGDPVAYLQIPAGGGRKSVLILRDIEMERARRHARADEVACPAISRRRAAYPGTAKRRRPRRLPNASAARG